MIMATGLRLSIVLCWCFVFGGSNAQGHYENVARDKPCTMSSTWKGPWDNQTPRSIELAVDGQTWNRDGWCVHSGVNDRNAYWEVDLGRPYPLHKMVAIGRYLYERRMSSIVVTVDGLHCFTFPINVNVATTTLYCVNGVMNGTRVRLSKVTPFGDDYAINLCEFQIDSCSEDYWGSDCDRQCGQCSTGTTCDKVTGVCAACQPGWMPDMCTQECNNGTYGQNCLLQCSAECSDVCNKVTGHCTCKPGWIPPTCVSECPGGWYGQSCVEQCGVGCTDTCDKASGACLCKPGWYPPLCQQQCRAGEYGQDCRQNCSVNCIGACHRSTGHCTCQPGFQPPLCNLECPSGTYGSDCQQNCSANCADGVCDKVTGYCTCKPGYRGQRCDQECAPGTYGQDCQYRCGQCLTSPSACHHVTGHCNYCYAYFAPPFCAVCLDNVYGVFCDKNCSAQCSDVCNKTTGYCTCNIGYQPPSCRQNCSSGYYGDQCVSKCGNCTSGESCDPHTGHCHGGCQSGLAPPLCQQTIQSQIAAEQEKKQTDIAVIVGPVVGVIVILALVVLILLFVRRRRQAGGGSNPKRSSVTRAAGNNNSKPATLTMDSVYQNVTPGLQLHDTASNNHSKANGSQKGKANSKPPTALKPKAKKTPSAPSTANGKAAVYANVKSPVTHSNSSLIGPLAMQAGQSMGSTGSLAPPIQQESESADLDTSRNDVYYNDAIYMTSEAACLRLDAVQQHLLDRLRSEDLDKEYAKLEKGLTRDCEAGMADVNHYKNRFSSILPYDDNRVVLHNAPHEGANDYINASYIRGWKSEKAYIASQGPRHNTLSDMWWMIWQEEISHIVMLTNTMETDRKKCEEYWPGLGEHKQYGAIDVSGLDVQERADYVIRTFQIKEKSSGVSRKVTQYHYVTWPDHDVPLVTPLVDFWCSVSTAYHAVQHTAPLLVHCSAGVGRTGAFIALDSLIQQSQHSKQLNVLHTATRLRHDRCNMIQTKGQYRLVYEAVLEAYTCRHCRIPVTSLDAVLRSHVDPHKDNDYVDKEFKKLQQMKVLLTKPSHSEAEKPENINKNRDVTLLPNDAHLVYLTYHVRGRNQYINAVYVPTLFRRKGCIMTQLPLHDTVVDFWRLAVGNDVNTIFSLGSEVNQADTATEEVYWPRHNGQTMTCGPFNVTLHGQNALGPNLTTYKLSVAAEDASKSTEVLLHHYTAWAKELPSDVTDLTQLLGLLTQNDANDATTAPVVLQCRDGVVRSGMVRALADVINRMTSESQVDVYTSVKHVQNVRPQSVSTAAQYRYLYHVIQRFAENSNIYQNT